MLKKYISLLFFFSIIFVFSCINKNIASKSSEYSKQIKPDEYGSVIGNIISIENDDRDGFVKYINIKPKIYDTNDFIRIILRVPEAIIILPDGGVGGIDYLSAGQEVAVKYIKMYIPTIPPIIRAREIKIIAADPVQPHILLSFVDLKLPQWDKAIEPKAYTIDPKIPESNKKTHPIYTSIQFSEFKKKYTKAESCYVYGNKVIHLSIADSGEPIDSKAIIESDIKSGRSILGQPIIGEIIYWKDHHGKKFAETKTMHYQTNILGYKAICEEDSFTQTHTKAQNIKYKIYVADRFIIYIKCNNMEPKEVEALLKKIDLDKLSSYKIRKTS